MKNIRIIALVLCFLMIVPALVACNIPGLGGEDTTTTTTTPATTTTTKKPEPVQPTTKLTIADLKFDAENEAVADGFSTSLEGDVVVKDGALKVEGGHGSYFISDDELLLNYENYESITISMKFSFDSFSSGNMSLISPLFCDEDHMTEENENGYIYQMFLKVNSDGGLYYWMNKHKWVEPITFNGETFKIKTGVTYNLDIEYNIEYGSYEIILDGITLVSDSLTTVMDHEYMTGFVFRLFDANQKIGAYSASIEDLKIVANPY